MPTTDISQVWRKSSRSGNGANCVEVAFAGDGIATRDSKNPAGPTLNFTTGQWTTFVSQLKS